MTATAGERPYETCEQCGFDAEEFDRAAAVDALNELDTRWRAMFAGHTRERLTTRPAPEVWSPVEYTVHTAGIVRWWREAADRMTAGEVLTMGSEDYPDADRDPYNETPVEEALEMLAAEVRAMAAFGRTASDDRWAAPLRLADRNSESFWHGFGVRDAGDGLRHALHDALHHVDDIRRDLAAT